jgi:hypothetical protein
VPVNEFDSTAPPAEVDSIAIEMSDMNIYTMRQTFRCLEPDHLASDVCPHKYEIGVDESATSSVLQGKCMVNVTVLRNLSKQRRDIPNNQYVSPKHPVLIYTSSKAFKLSS